MSEMLTPSVEEPATLKIIREPRIYVVGRQSVIDSEVQRFLADEGRTWETDTTVAAEQLAEMAGRVCYMSYGKGRKTNAAFIEHIIGVGHGSVLEHEVWSMLLTGVSRSCTHEVVRHRHFSYSQLSQRYVDEADTAFVEPDAIAADFELHARWVDEMRAARAGYIALVDVLMLQFAHITNPTDRRKLARQAARSVLPNATETKLFMTGNARAWRNFLELRGSAHAESEIRKVAFQLLGILQRESPNSFGDYRIETNADGIRVITTDFVKV